MSQQHQSRVLRYSKAPSLSTISSYDEEEFDTARFRDHNTNPAVQKGCEDYIISPLTEQEKYPTFPANTYTRAPPSYRSSTVHSTPPDSDSRSLAPTLNNHPGTYRDPRTPSGPTDFSFGGREPDTKAGPTPSMTETDPDAEVKGDRDVYLKTEWMWMLLVADKIPAWQNMAAAMAAWLLLAAYLVLPATFTTLKASEAFKADDPSEISGIARAVTKGIDNLGLAIFSALLAGSAGAGCFILWACHYKNYYWLCIRIFMPVMLNSLAGLLTTIVSVYSSQKGIWSFTAKINAIISGSTAGFSAIAYAFYYFVLLRRVKKEHDSLFPHKLRADAMKRERKWKDLFVSNPKGNK